MYTTCALEAACAYEYGFARKDTYFVHIRHVRSRGIVRTSTALRIKRLIAYVYSFARKATYAYEVRILRVKQLMFQGLSRLRRRGDDS